MILNKTTLLILFISHFSFGQINQTELSAFFSESEIEDLNLITDFVQFELCGTIDRVEFGDCIINTIPSLIDSKQVYPVSKIRWRKQKKIYSKISKNTFNKIWGLCKNWRTIEPKYEYEMICFNQNETFIKFVNALSSTSPALKGYGDKLRRVGRFTPLNDILINIYEYPQNTDLNDRGIQILLAIHFLTENDYVNRDKRAVRLEKRDLRILNEKANKNNN